MVDHSEQINIDGGSQSTKVLMVGHSEQCVLMAGKGSLSFIRVLQTLVSNACYD